MSPRARLLAATVCLAVAAVCVRLGFWQQRRLTERRTANAAALAQRERPPVRLGEDPAPDLDGRRVAVEGTFDRTHEVVLRGRAWRDQPGVEVVTPLRIAGQDTAVLVLRGFVPAPDAVSADVAALDEPGPQRVVGVATRIGDDGPGERLERPGAVTTWRRLDLAALRAATPYPLRDVLVRQQPDSRLPRWPRRLEPPSLDDGPHVSYMLQWWSFATIALVGGALLARRPGPQRDVPPAPPAPSS